MFEKNMDKVLSLFREVCLAVRRDDPSQTGMNHNFYLRERNKMAPWMPMLGKGGDSVVEEQGYEVKRQSRRTEARQKAGQ